MTKQIKNDDVINDNLMNAATAMGVAGKARNPATVFAAPVKLNYGELQNIYQGDGFGKLIVDIYANEMTREWIKIDGDPDGLLLQYFKRLKAKTNFTQGLKWSRLYGASVILMIIDDGGELTDPVNVGSIKTIDSVRTIDRTQLSIQFASDWYTDPTLSNYGKPMIYTVSPPRYTTSNKGTTLILSSYRVHESRVLRFDGDIMPDALMIENAGFGYSVLGSIYNYLRNLTQGYEYSAEILHDFTTFVLSIKNLSNIVASKNGVSKLKTRAEIMNYCKSVLNGILIDADGESVQTQTTSVNGLTDLLEKFGLALSAVTRIPYMVLMGESPSGLNASSDNTVRSWYDSLSSEQEDILTEPLTKILTYILAAKDNPLKGKSINDVNIVFNDLWQYDEPTTIDMRNKQAQSDALYVENQIVMPGEIATARFGNDQYSFETQIDEGLHD